MLNPKNPKHYQFVGQSHLIFISFSHAAYIYIIAFVRFGGPYHNNQFAKIAWNGTQPTTYSITGFIVAQYLNIIINMHSSRPNCIHHRQRPLHQMSCSVAFSIFQFLMGHPRGYSMLAYTQMDWIEWSIVCFTHNVKNNKCFLINLSPSCFGAYFK